eukprot:3779415-Prymnesium_polylepis.1
MPKWYESISDHTSSIDSLRGGSTARAPLTIGKIMLASCRKNQPTAAAGFADSGSVPSIQRKLLGGTSTLPPRHWTA